MTRAATSSVDCEMILADAHDVADVCARNGHAIYMSD